MDHADWVQRNISASKALASKRRPKVDRHGCRVGWTQAPDKLTTFQARVFDIIGMSLGGIYNAPITWDSIEWGSESDDSEWDHLMVPLRHGELATFDGCGLTFLVLLCHEARIRLSISPRMRGLELRFHKRHAEGGYSRRHPNIEEAVAGLRKLLPADSRVPYRPAGEEAPPPTDPAPMATEALRLVLTMAPSFQGGHSRTGDAVAKFLGVDFPIRVTALEVVARARGFDPDELWPWLREVRRAPAAKAEEAPGG